MNNENPEVEPDHTLCQFGRWMQLFNDLLGDLTEFQALEQPHRLLHQCYHELQNSPDQKQLKQVIQSHSNQLINNIDALEKRVSQLS